MIDMNHNKQDGGFMGGLISTRIEDTVKQLNQTLKIELENIKTGQGHRFTTRFRMEVDEKRGDIHEIINSDYNVKRQLYTLISQWAAKYGKLKHDGKAPFEIFLEDLQSIFGKNETGINTDGDRSIYDDQDFYNALQSNIKEYISTELGSVTTTDPKKTEETIIHILGTLTNSFTALKTDPSVVRTLGLCESILQTLAISASKNPISFMDTIASIYSSLPMFRYGCGEQKIIEMALLWLETDSADGRVADGRNYTPQQFDLILKKLGTFEQLFIILPSLVTDRRMKNILYGKTAKDNGKIINWMKYVRQFLNTRKWDTVNPKDKGRYWKAFVDSYYNLLKFTFPQLFGSQEAELPIQKGFFSGLSNMFSQKVEQGSDFKKISKNLYAETINWLNIVKPHEYVRLLRAALNAFPNIITYRNFPRATELDNKILGIFELYIDRETGQPKKQEGKFEQMKNTLDSLGKLLKDHKQDGNVIDKLYNDHQFNLKFYKNLKKVIEFYPEDAAKFGFTLEKTDANWDIVNADFYDKLFETVIAIDGIVLEDGIEELEDFVTHRLELDTVEQFLPRRITGKSEMKDETLIKYIKEEKPGKNSIIRKEIAKEPFIKILLALKKEFKNINPKAYQQMYILETLVEPNNILAYYMNNEFYNKGNKSESDPHTDPLKQIKKDTEGYNPKNNKDNVENTQRIDPKMSLLNRDISLDIQDPEISAVIDENLPEVSSLSNEIVNLLKIIEEQGNHLSQTDTLIDQLIQDESTLLDSVSTKIDDVNKMIEANDLHVHAKKKKSKTTTTTKNTVKTVTEEQTGGSNQKYYVGQYQTGGSSTNLYKLSGKDVYFYITKNNKNKRVDINSSRISF